MATFKICLLNPQRQSKSGNTPVVIRLTHDRRIAMIPTGISVVPQQIRRGEVNDPHILSVLNARIMRFNQYLVDMNDILDYVSAKDLKEALLQREAEENRPKTRHPAQGIDLLDFWEHEFLPSVKSVSTRSVYRSSYNRLKGYVGTFRLPTAQLTLRFLLAYEDYLTQNGVGQRGLNLYMTHLKCVFNRAKDFYNDEDGRDVLIPNNPFAKYKIPAPPPPKKTGALTKEQLRAIIDYKPVSTREELAKDCFVMSLFLAGINSVDLYYTATLSNKWVLEYERTKTKTRRSDRALQLITVPEYLRPLFMKYKDRIGDRVLNFHIRYATEKEFNAAINKGLKRIGAAIGIPGLYFYQARHSFATIARNALRFSLDDVGKCLTHVPTNPVTDIYIDQDFGIVDQVNQAVLEWVLE